MTDNENAGTWRLTAEGAVRLRGDGPLALLVPTEDVLLLAVDLPVAGRAARLAALPFAVEDRIATPLATTHVALGAEIAPRRYLAAAVAHATMADWVARAEAAGLAHLPLVPDALALPVPGDGLWTVAEEATRVIARLPDGTGLALPPALFAAAGAPAVSPWDGIVASPVLDLRQAPYAGRPAYNPWRRLAVVAGVGLAAHAAIAAADTAALGGIANRWQAETAATLGVPVTDELASLAMARLPQSGGTAAGPPGPFLPLVGRASAALAGGAATVRAIRYDGGRVTLDLSGDVAGAERALAAAGLSPRRTGDSIAVGGA